MDGQAANSTRLPNGLCLRSMIINPYEPDNPGKGGSVWYEVVVVSLVIWEATE